MINDFSKPQRQSAAGIIIMAANTFQQIIRALILPVLIYAFRGHTKTWLTFSILTGAILLLILVFSYLSYRRFTFHLNTIKQEFIIRKGIFNRTHLTIQLSKIQQVNINQSVLQKLIGVYNLQIDTPGDDKKEVNIPAISGEAAYRLKEHLLNGHPEEFVSDTPTSLHPKRTEILRLSTSTLLKVGLTSNYGSSLGLLIGFSYATIHQIKEVLKALDTDNGQFEEALKNGLSVFSLGLLTFILITIILFINVIRTLVKYFDFEVIRHKLSLLISSGLFAKKNTLISPEKVQITTYSQNYFQRKLNLINLNLKQAHDGTPQSDRELYKANLEIPGCSEQEKNELLLLILGRIPEKGQRFIPNYRFLNLPVFFKVIIPLLIYWSCTFYFPEIRSYYPLCIGYFLIGIWMIYMSYKRHAIAVSRDFICKRSGIWDVTEEIIVPKKIQAITTFQYPWHKRADVGHIELHTAAGILRFKYGNYTEIKRLANYWLYQIESSSEEWM